MRISVELVLRNKELFLREVEEVKKNFPLVEVLNIPDLTRYPLRSWEGCSIAKPFFEYVIPHIRARDIDRNAPFIFKDKLTEDGVGEVLVIAGDQQEDSPDTVRDRATLDIISKFKKEMPQVKIYAGIDPYRGSFNEEAEYIRMKIDSGVSGFFTQPFFDLREVESFVPLVKNVEVFWGITPVLNKGMKDYWEKVNKVLFPEDFEISLDWNRNFAREMLSFAGSNNFNVYFMPIKIDVVKYLGGIV